MLVVPPMEGKRWWIMEIIDAWNDVPAAPGSRTHGDKGGNFALIGPHFKGTLPAGLEEIKMDTSLVAVGGRTYTGGKADYDAVHKIQDQYLLIPLSQWKGAGTKFTPPASVPVKLYWSATAYDRATHALIRDLPWSSRASNTPGLTKNADGSVDVYFGPKAPAGKESNWVSDESRRAVRGIVPPLWPREAVLRQDVEIA